MDKTKIIVVHESVKSSIIKDTVTFGMIVAVLAFNHLVLTGRWWVDVILIIMALVSIASKKNKDIRTFYSWDAVRAYIKNELRKEKA